MCFEYGGVQVRDCSTQMELRLYYVKKIFYLPSTSGGTFR